MSFWRQLVPLKQATHKSIYLFISYAYFDRLHQRSSSTRLSYGRSSNECMQGILCFLFVSVNIWKITPKWRGTFNHNCRALLLNTRNTWRKLIIWYPDNGRKTSELLCNNTPYNVPNNAIMCYVTLQYTLAMFILHRSFHSNSLVLPPPR